MVTSGATPYAIYGMTTLLDKSVIDSEVTKRIFAFKKDKWKSTKKCQQKESKTSNQSVVIVIAR